jgi:adenylate kinase family enzyme
MMPNWILLTYKLPSEPSAPRVYLWRKLKKLGAETIFDAVWILPDTPRTHEQFQWLAAEIQEMGGEAMFWQAQSEFSGQDEKLMALFTRHTDEAYQTLFNRMQDRTADIATLAHEYQQIKQRDYFESSMGQQVRERFLALRGENS